ncbi:transcription-repair coupling factor, partial [Stieleria sp. ICT_E10.1]|nr:transcription-repair coupling factor [Stieleria sedimenti]
MSIASPLGTQRLHEIVDLLDEHARISEAIAGCSPGDQLAFSGVWGSLRAVLAAAAARRCPNLLMLLPQAADADIVAGDAIAFGLADSVALPLSVGRSGKHALADSDLAERLQVLQKLRGRDSGDTNPLLVTAYIGGAIQLVPTPAQLAASTRGLAVGDEIEMDEVARWLDQSGFVATTAVQLPGEYATRGGLMDIFSVDQSNPIRVEWFGDEIESIRKFDLGSQRSVESINEVEITAVGADDQTSEDSLHDIDLGPITDYLPDDTLV